MKTRRLLIATAALLSLSAPLVAQTDPHHPTATAAIPVAGATTETMDAQCAAMMMPMMTQMMPMMMQMMQSGMIQGGMMGGGMMGADGTAMPGAMPMTDATKAYRGAMTMMTAPMMQGAQNANPDVGFVQALIAQRSGSVALAKAVLQYGTDAQVKTWANEILAAAPAETARLQAWLDSQPK